MSTNGETLIFRAAKLKGFTVVIFVSWITKFAMYCNVLESVLLFSVAWWFKTIATKMTESVIFVTMTFFSLSILLLHLGHDRSFLYWLFFWLFFRFSNLWRVRNIWLVCKGSFLCSRVAFLTSLLILW